jgi:hypothetical protein
MRITVKVDNLPHYTHRTSAFGTLGFEETLITTDSWSIRWTMNFHSKYYGDGVSAFVPGSSGYGMEGL